MVNLTLVTDMGYIDGDLVIRMTNKQHVHVNWLHIGRDTDTPRARMARIRSMLDGEPSVHYRISIFGFAGFVPTDATCVLDRDFYKRMASVATKSVDAPLGWPLSLAAGCATWADHVAVTIFLDTSPGASVLILYAPCKWHYASNRFEGHTLADVGDDAALVAKSERAADELNAKHAEFSKVLGHDTRTEIGLALKAGAVMDTSHPGFKARDAAVAKHALDAAIAFAWSHTGKPEHGGTKHTWDLCPETPTMHFVSLYGV